MEPKETLKPLFDLKVFLAKAKRGRTETAYRADESIYIQGEPADAIYYIREGKVKLTVLSKQGKEAVVAILKDGEFFAKGAWRDNRYAWAPPWRFRSAPS